MSPDPVAVEEVVTEKVADLTVAAAEGEKPKKEKKPKPQKEKKDKPAQGEQHSQQGSLQDRINSTAKSGPLSSSRRCRPGERAESSAATKAAAASI
jgi:hypothetical protein